MAESINTKSTLTFGGSSNTGRNRTSTAISTNILIMVEHNPVGAVQTMTINEKRGGIKMVDEVGTDGHIDSVPSSSTNISGTCNRIRFDRLRVAEAFSRGFIHVAAQVYPFDIVIIDRQAGGDLSTQISTVIKNVWIDGIDYSYSATDWVITDNMSWQAETIFSTLNNGPVANAGERKFKFSINDIERGTDSGASGRRGSLDAAGLINIGSDGTLF